jgi:8-oxo-dGTP pyrophosphatase MutT (NUDIX family)
MGVERWSQIEEELVADMRIFQLVRLSARSPRTGQLRDLARVHAGDWVNVIPVTDDGQVVLVRQYRHGVDEITLEIPGGLIDAGETPLEAARRETQEETGFSGGNLISLGVVQPNPAFIDNRCHSFLLEGCRRTHDLALDDGEDIEVVSYPLARISTLIAEGAIRHALVICAFAWWAMRPDSPFALRGSDPG